MPDEKMTDRTPEEVARETYAKVHGFSSWEDYTGRNPHMRYDIPAVDVIAQALREAEDRGLERAAKIVDSTHGYNDAAAFQIRRLAEGGEHGS